MRGARERARALALTGSLFVLLSTASVQAKTVISRADGSVESEANVLCEHWPHSAQVRASRSELIGSRWQMEYEAVGKHQRFELMLLPDARLLSNHPNDRTPDNDHWESKGRYVLLRFNESYAVYAAVLNKEGNRLQGTAVNEVGKQWQWRAHRLPDCSQGIDPQP